MSQLTVYLDDDIIKKINLAAKLEHDSISKWVKNKLTEAINNQWPQNYFDLFGSLADDELKRPAQTDFNQDIKRTRL